MARRVLLGVVLAGLGAVTFQTLPDLLRYLRMRAM
jgi:hypothetical protein